MVLTKAAILHRDYLHLYTHTMPQAIRDYVDRHMNCEDVAMQFLVSNSSGLPPVFVRGTLTDLGTLGGISTKPSHMMTRSDCLDGISSFYTTTDEQQTFPLVLSHTVVNKANSWLSNQPVTWWEYVASDLPIPIFVQVTLVLFVIASPLW
eukprot:CAMPEP_0185761954 /NCGR_PEP_ID=MMETSP1174-20130828/20906_1 /TAXON_ID=35687 /ORGANISM="Dictyocha speculum, Strain CCMP1381" /LENGTH=149 /DNA_ID=CAMNT_0028443405 /DNA_START=22 /DNA_END=468 /DNA_ORIENTATION=-